MSRVRPPPCPPPNSPGLSEESVSTIMTLVYLVIGSTFALAFAAALVVGAESHAAMSKTFVKRNGQTACAMHTSDPECSSSITYRELISRGAGSIPGEETSYFCERVCVE